MPIFSQHQKTGRSCPSPSVLLVCDDSLDIALQWQQLFLLRRKRRANAGNAGNAYFLMFKAPKQLPKNAVIYGLAGKWIAFKRNSTGNIKFLSSTIAGLSPISLNQCWEWCTVHQPRWSPTQHLCHVIDFIRVTRTDDRCHLLPPSRNRRDDVGIYGFKCVINKSNTCRLCYPFNMLFGFLLWGKGFTE